MSSFQAFQLTLSQDAMGQRLEQQRSQLVDRWAGTGPRQVESRRDRLSRERQAAEDRPGAFQAVGHAISSEWMASWAGRSIGRRGYEFDRDFNAFADDDTFKRLTADLPQDMWGMFDEAQSLPHALRIREQALEVANARQKLASLGWTGAGLRMGAMILDPAALLVTAGTAGIGGPAVYGAKLTRMQRLVRGGMIAGGSEAAIEGFLMTQDPQRSVSDVLFAGAGGFLLGGGANVWQGARLDRTVHRVQKDIEFAELVQGAVESGAVRADTPAEINRLVAENVLTSNGRAHFRDQLSPERQAEFRDTLIMNSGLDPVADADMIAGLREMEPADAAAFFGNPGRLDGDGMAGMDGETVIESTISTAHTARAEDGTAIADEAVGFGGGGGGRGAGGAPPRESIPDQPPVPGGSLPPSEGWGVKHAGDFDPSRTSGARAAFSNIRRSFSSLLGSSDVESVRRAASMYADDPLLKVDGSGGTEAASMWVQRQFSTRMAGYYRESLPEFRAWAAEHRKGTVASDASRIEFFEEVGRAVRHPRGQYTADAHINKVADIQRELQRDLLGVAKRHRVKGFQNVDPNDTYLMRVWNQGRMTQATAKHGEDAITRVFARAIQVGSDDLAEDAAVKIAKAFTRTIRRLDEYSDLQKARLFSEDNADDLARILRENVPEITDAQVEDILWMTQRRDPTAGTPPRARRRLRLDENYRHQMEDGSWLSIADLLENNAETLMNTYARQMVGSAASSEIYRSFRRSADDVVETFDQLKGRLETDMRQSGVDAQRVARDLELLETLDKHVRGVPLTKNTQTAATLRRLRAVTHMIYSGQFGVAQIGEFGNIVAEMGFKTMLNHVPAVAGVIRRARDGKLPNALLDEIESWVGLGTERMTGQVYNRFDASGDMLEFGGGALDRQLRRGARFSNDLSFMAPINSGLQRLAGAAAAQRLTDAAMSGRPMSAKRLQGLGLSADDAEAMYGQIRQHVTTEEGLLGRKLKRMNLDEWDDVDAASRFVSALDRWSRRAIQTSDIGAMHPFMTTDLGRVIFQFRSFVIQAWEKQFLHRVQMRDWQAFTSTAYVGLVAGMAYVGQQYVMSLGRPDAEEYRRERLSADAIAKASVQRAAWSSILPGVVDTAGYLTGADPVFTYRNTGMDTDFFFGNPITDTVQSAGRAARGTGLAARGEDFTQTDARAWSNLLPFRRVFGIANVVEAFNQEFPER